MHFIIVVIIKRIYVISTKKKKITWKMHSIIVVIIKVWIQIKNKKRSELIDHANNGDGTALLSRVTNIIMKLTSHTCLLFGRKLFEWLYFFLIPSCYDYSVFIIRFNHCKWNFKILPNKIQLLKYDFKFVKWHFKIHSTAYMIMLLIFKYGLLERSKSKRKNILFLDWTILSLDDEHQMDKIEVPICLETWTNVVLILAGPMLFSCERLLSLCSKPLWGSTKILKLPC